MQFASLYTFILQHAIIVFLGNRLSNLEEEQIRSGCKPPLTEAAEGLQRGLWRLSRSRRNTLGITVVFTTSAYHTYTTSLERDSECVELTNLRGT